MGIEDYIDTAAADDIGTPVAVERRRRDVYSIAAAGALGRNILNDIVGHVVGLKPVSGHIHIEVDIGIEDRRWFGDDEERKSRLIIDVGLDKEAK